MTTDELAGVQTIVSEAGAAVHTIGGDWWRSIAVTALRVLRPFIKMDSTQSAAWDVVVMLLGGST